MPCGRFAEHAFHLTRIARCFLEAIAGTPRPGDTTPELIQHLESSSLDHADLVRIAGLFRIWDRLKFARAPSSVEEAAPPLAGLAREGERLFVGGPVQPQGAVVLAQFEYPDAAGLLVFDSIGFLIGDVDPDELVGVRRARVFAGYAGWGGGQLETEIEMSAWMLEPALPEDVFAQDPETLWNSVLRRKGGRFAMLALMPLDPSSN